MNNNWHKRFLANAELVAKWSKDPKRQVGCVIMNDEKQLLSGGFNGFPRGIADDWRLTHKESKHKIIVHAEANAVAAAARNGHSLKDGTAYVTLRPCPQCASLLIQAGIKCVVTPDGVDETSNVADCDFAEFLLIEAGVRVFKV